MISVDSEGGADADAGGLLWTFGMLYDSSEKIDQMLLRTQLTAFHSWLDGIKTMEAVDAIVTDMAKACEASDRHVRGFNEDDGVQILRQVGRGEGGLFLMSAVSESVCRASIGLA